MANAACICRIPASGTALRVERAPRLPLEDRHKMTARTGYNGAMTESVVIEIFSDYV